MTPASRSWLSYRCKLGRRNPMREAMGLTSGAMRQRVEVLHQLDGGGVPCNVR